MLESVIENENVSKLFLFRQPASFISICANDDWNISKPLLHEKRFVAGLLPVRTYNQHTAADSAVASRQDHRPKSAIAQFSPVAASTASSWTGTASLRLILSQRIASWRNADGSSRETACCSRRRSQRPCWKSTFGRRLGACVLGLGSA